MQRTNTGNAYCLHIQMMFTSYILHSTDQVIIVNHESAGIPSGTTLVSLCDQVAGSL